MSSIRHALLFGATGLVGSHLLEQALADGNLHVTAVTRRALPLHHERLTNLLVSDFAQLDTQPAPAGIDLAFSCLGTTLKQAGGKAGFHAVDHDLVLRCAGWAQRGGVRHFLTVSAMGADERSPVYYNRVKAETERDLIALGFAQLTIFQPSLLLGEREGPFRPAEALALKLSPLFSPLMIGPLAPYTPVLGRDVARAMLRRALQAPATVPVERLRWKEIRALAG
ncbi:MAG: NAD(P)H-binding protein [Pseudomonadota bacterium]